MMKFIRKAISVILAGAVAAAAFCTGASAAGSTDLKIRTFPLLSVNEDSLGVEYMGQGLFHIKGGVKDYVYWINDKSVSEWQKNGKFSATYVRMESSVDGFDWHMMPENRMNSGNYGVVEATYANGVKAYTAVTFDKSMKKIDGIYSSKSILGVSKDGYVSEMDYDKRQKLLTVRIVDPIGRKALVDYDFVNGAAGTWAPFSYGNKYAMVTYYKAIGVNVTGKVYLIGQDESTRRIYDGTTCINPMIGSNYTAFEHLPYGTVQVTRTDKVSTVQLKHIAEYRDSKKRPCHICSLGESLYGNTAIAYYKRTTGGEDFYTAALVDVKEDKIISPVYSDITTCDGQIFAATASNGKCAYYNVNGKKLADGFASVGAFAEGDEVAPVVRDGKLYFVDRSMNRVSGMMSVDRDAKVCTYGKGLFSYTSGGEFFFLTYSGTAKSSVSAPGKTTLSASKSGSTYSFSWKAVSGADRYEIYYLDGSKYVKVATAKGSATSCKVVLKSTKKRQFVIRAVKVSGGIAYNGKYSAPVTV